MVEPLSLSFKVFKAKSMQLDDRIYWYFMLHFFVAGLNEDLVKLLMERDELHMEQDSMLVDVEDLTR